VSACAPQITESLNSPWLLRAGLQTILERILSDYKCPEDFDKVFADEMALRAGILPGEKVDLTEYGEDGVEIQGGRGED